MARKVIVTVAQTGAFHGKDANPNLPITPQEIADSAYDCYNAGAAVVHIHARDKEGVSTNDPSVYNEIGSRIRAKCNISTQYSTAPANRAGAAPADGTAPAGGAAPADGSAPQRGGGRGGAPAGAAGEIGTDAPAQ